MNSHEQKNRQWRAFRIIGAFLFFSFCGCSARQVPQVSSSEDILLPNGPAVNSNESLHGFIEEPSDDDYSLGPGDVLIVRQAVPEINGTDTIKEFEVTVAGNGTVYVSEVSAYVSVAGKTLPEASMLIRKALSRFYRHPRVELSLREKISSRVTVTGSVMKPGPYPIVPGTTVFNVLAWAGGLNENTSGMKVYVVREGKRILFDLKSLKTGVPDGSETSFVLKPGDAVFVPEAETVSVLGEVKNPQQIRLTRPYTIQEAVAASGGFTEYAVRENVMIVNASGTSTMVDMRNSRHLTEGDVLYVRPTRWKKTDEWLERFGRLIGLRAF
ncbi:MAG: hypothetical protein COU90_03715 [Candidatus Ryanbacteria bacterium CG10_big_fil_rev_8_21_14_0_10_43_42]|uniref:Soluble ligand binding domain-containing protein n=1 Tax=Candidatus Ryanbacteria bacterium CG10_big_fil_rev_8_21_14_0_10_43_42 TaxID=1974864 RepID=A0A2M8KWA6_9BACT|nr:MAG: hypothetical protein COU90_03715 [Candidatus Ryanbacteria bacterium CG10_big_fil_rev_8_21_14_0_10_43_42]